LEAEMETTAKNPLANLAQSIPQQTARGASVAGRLFAAGLAMTVAFDQSYDPTQVFVVVVAALVAATVVPLTGALGDIAAGLGAGLAFFGGAVLTHLAPGLAMLAIGAFAGLGAAVVAAKANRDATLVGIGFVAAVFVTGALQGALVFGFER